MPGLNQEQKHDLPPPPADRRERVVHVADIEGLIASGNVLPVADIISRGDGGADEQYMLVFIQGHGIGLISKQTDRVYILATYGLLCLARGAGLDRPSTLIEIPAGVEVDRD